MGIFVSSTTTIEAIQSRQRSHRLRNEWHKLVSALVCESNRPCGMRNQLALGLAYHIIICMMQLDPKSHKSSILLLPHILIEMHLFEACYEFLKLIQLRNIPRTCFKNLSSFTKDVNKCYINEPIQILCDEKNYFNAFLLLDLIFIKIRYKDKLCAMQALSNQCKSLKKDNLKIDQVLDCVAKYLFISDKWKKMNPLVLERQALDLVKLVFQMNSLLLQNFIQSAENSSDIFFQTMPLHVRLLLSRWRLDLKALSFLKSAVSDCRRAA